jgi:hypothetical protein
MTVLARVAAIFDEHYLGVGITDEVVPGEVYGS